MQSILQASKGNQDASSPMLSTYSMHSPRYHALKRDPRSTLCLCLILTLLRRAIFPSPRAKAFAHMGMLRYALGPRAQAPRRRHHAQGSQTMSAQPKGQQPRVALMLVPYVALSANCATPHSAFPPRGPPPSRPNQCSGFTSPMRTHLQLDGCPAPRPTSRNTSCTPGRAEHCAAPRPVPSHHTSSMRARICLVSHSRRPTICGHHNPPAIVSSTAGTIAWLLARHGRHGCSIPAAGAAVDERPARRAAAQEQGGRRPHPLSCDGLAIG